MMHYDIALTNREIGKLVYLVIELINNIVCHIQQKLQYEEIRCLNASLFSSMRKFATRIPPLVSGTKQGSGRFAVT